VSYYSYNDAKLLLGPLDAVSYSSDFSSDSDGWNFTRATLTAPDTHAGESNSMRMGLTATAGQHFIYRTLFYGGYGRKATGGTYKIKFKYYLPSANPNVDSILINQGPTCTLDDCDINPRLSVKDSWTEVETTLVGNSTQYLFFYALNGAGSSSFTGSTSDLFYLKDIEIIYGDFDYPYAEPYFCENVGISLQSAIEPVYLAANKSSFDYQANKDINGSLSFTYYLTGRDPLREFMTNEKAPLSGSFAGLSFKSGYLTNYSFSFENYQPVRVSASVNFYGGLEGTFAPTRLNFSEVGGSQGREYLNYYNATMTGVSGVLMSNAGETAGQLSAISAQYTFNSQIDPVYVVGEVLPREIRFLRKQTSVNMDIYNPFLTAASQPAESSQTYTGQLGELAFSLQTSGNVAMESYKVRGRLNSQNVSTSVGRKITNTISLVQDSYQDSPQILGVSGLNGTAKGNAYQPIEISGVNLLNTVSVNFTNSNVTGFEELTNIHATFGCDKIKTQVPKEAIDGPITVQTLGGIARSESFNVLSPTEVWNA
tara:strand:+ start:1181 stop:2800 length:1620 start_codon:yes stop_codon:yes gene_type:complete